METENIVTKVMNDEKVGAQVTELIDAGKNVIVDMQSDGSAVVSEAVKAGGLGTYAPLAGVVGASFIGGVVATLVAQSLWKHHKEKKEKADIDAAFAEKAKTEAAKAAANGGKVDDTKDAEVKEETKSDTSK